ncbi:MAG: filamin/ABP280 repeat domain-containing protein, partial [archaeon]|nr:filamin/ABP280 repeat domain-containing protein [archaeon]
MAASSARAPSVAWFDIQENTFTRWCNEHLKERGLHINALKTDLSNGVLLINLIEIISHPKTIGRYNLHPRIPIQKVENVNLALKFLENEGIRLVNIGGEDIVGENIKLILGLIWTLILRYQINKGGGDGLDELLRWVQSKIPEKGITGFTGKDWNDGTAVACLTNVIAPGSLPSAKSMSPADKFNNAKTAMDTATRELAIPQVLRPEELNHPKVDSHAVAAYISYFRDAELQGRSKRSLASQASAYGDGLVEGIVNKQSNFQVQTAGGKLAVRVVGPKNDTPVQITDKGNGCYDVSYTPTVPGNYEVHVTVDGEHIPGSVFHVRVLGQISAGGEGKIIVFYSTTSSSNKGRSDNTNLQRLLEAKGVHLRPTFTPFVPVDVLSPSDRDAIFEKVGTRVLPIVL